MSTVEIRDLSLEEADVAATFFHEHWRANHIFQRNRELLLWLYHFNPYASLFSRGLTFRAVFDGRKNVGVFAYMPFVFNRYGNRRFGCHLSAWWVHPDRRRGPLGLSLLHSLQEDSPFDACIAGMNTPVAERLYERMAWVVVHAIPRLVFVVQIEQCRSLLNPAVSMPSSVTHVVQKPSPAEIVHVGPAMRNEEIEVFALKSFDELPNLRWDDFYWQRIAPAQMGPARESVYLRWRYQDVPVFRYEALLARSRGEVSGLLVYRVEQIQDSEHRIIRLVDIVAEPCAIPPLVDMLKQRAALQQLAFIDFFCTHSSYLDQLIACGFADARDSSGERYWLPYLFQPLDHTRSRLNSAWWIRDMDLRSAAARSDFCIMKGDYEFDRPN